MRSTIILILLSTIMSGVSARPRNGKQRITQVAPPSQPTITQIAQQEVTQSSDMQPDLQQSDEPAMQPQIQQVRPSSMQPQIQPSVQQFTTSSDAPFSVDQTTLQAAITCPEGIQKRAGGIVFLVHGTSTTAVESWQDGPYHQQLASTGPGYDICWVELPNAALGDAQISAEFVAYGVRYLAPQSATGRVAVIGHSQGAGLNIPWALMFWPSIRQFVYVFIALAGDFKGTMPAALLCTPLTGGCNPAIWQQVYGSRYITAQNAGVSGSAGSALVPTTSIYSETDEIVQPESPPQRASSNLPGATSIALQTVCPGFATNHAGMLRDAVVYTLALDALTNGAASLSRFDSSSCSAGGLGAAINPGQFPSVLNGLTNVIGRMALGQRTMSEPPLQPYVCQRGFASDCGTAF